MSMYDASYCRNHYKFKELSVFFEGVGMEVDIKSLDIPLSFLPERDFGSVIDRDTPVIVISKDGFHSTVDAYIMQRMDTESLIEHLYLKFHRFYIKNKLQDRANG